MDVQVSPTEKNKFYVLSDDGTNADNYNGCYSYITYTTNIYTIGYRTARARLPRMQELVAIGCNVESDSCPRWSYGGIYWTSTAHTLYTNYAWCVLNNGSFDNGGGVNNAGIRPVITISKSNIK